MAYSVLIADDYRMIRQMFEDMIERSEDFRLSGTAADAEEAVEHCKSHQVDLVLLDVVMGTGRDGLEAAAQIKDISPETKILLVTSMPEVSYIKRAREIGVESFWHKEVQELPLLEVMERTMAGDSVYPAQTPVVWLGNTVSTELTERELDVLRELVGGAGNAEIAEKLGISERCVKMHITDMLSKTGFKNRLQLAVRARAGGLVINDIDPNGQSLQVKGTQ